MFGTYYAPPPLPRHLHPRNDASEERILAIALPYSGGIIMLHLKLSL